MVKANGTDPFAAEVKEPEFGWSKKQIVEWKIKLRNLLESWRSRFRFVITLKETTRKVIRYNTLWCRKPTPHEPVPKVRCNVDFYFRFSSRDKELSTPRITYRIEHDSLVYKELKNIDRHILRALKMKSTWIKQNPLALENAGVLDTRLNYDASVGRALVGPSPNEITSGFVEMEMDDVTKLERQLVNMFVAADVDGNGELDPSEFADLIMASGLGFNQRDVDMILSQYDSDTDGGLAYREFVGVAVDMLHARKAKRHADVKHADLLKEAKILAATRMHGLRPALRRAQKLWYLVDTDKVGYVSAAEATKILAQMPGDLKEAEIEYVIEHTPRTCKGDFIYASFEQKAANLVCEAISSCFLESRATDAELYLRTLFLEGAQGEDALPLDTMVQIIEDSGRIPLTYIHVHAIGANYENKGDVDLREFARYTALLVHQLFSMSHDNKALIRAGISPLSIFQGRSRAVSKLQIKSKFREFDSDNDGFITIKEFHEFIADTNMCMSEEEVDELVKNNFKADKISIDEFMAFAFGPLLQLARDAALKSQFAGKKLND